MPCTDHNHPSINIYPPAIDNTANNEQILHADIPSLLNVFHYNPIPTPNFTTRRDPLAVDLAKLKSHLTKGNGSVVPYLKKLVNQVEASPINM